MTTSRTRTMTHTEGVLGEVLNERHRQVHEYGYDADHDDASGPAALLRRGVAMVEMGRKMGARTEVIQGIAVIVAALESRDRILGEDTTTVGVQAEAPSTLDGTVEGEPVTFVDEVGVVPTSEPVTIEGDVVEAVDLATATANLAQATPFVQPNMDGIREDQA